MYFICIIIEFDLHDNKNEQPQLSLDQETKLCSEYGKLATTECEECRLMCQNNLIILTLIFQDQERS